MGQVWKSRRSSPHPRLRRDLSPLRYAARGEVMWPLRGRLPKHYSSSKATVTPALTVIWPSDRPPDSAGPSPLLDWTFWDMLL